MSTVEMYNNTMTLRELNKTSKLHNKLYKLSQQLTLNWCCHYHHHPWKRCGNTFSPVCLRVCTVRASETSESLDP